MITMFTIDELGRNMKCSECGKAMNKGKQLKMVNGAGPHFMLSRKFVCPFCAEKWIEKTETELSKLINEIQP